MPHDLKLKTDIEEELEFEPALDAASIGVSVVDGVATLSGHVPSFYERQVAERAASRVKGVRAIAEELTVKLPFDVRHEDTEIASRASNILEWGSLVPVHKGRVTVDHGWVTLSGQVDWQFQKTFATDSVRRLSGVTGVTNQITVTSHVSKGDVRSHIIKAFKRNGELESAGVHIKVDGGRVNLTGKVNSWRDRRMAEQAVWSIPSVTEVIDELVVA
jgi:osmotically-inducible protein OsmY